MDVRFPERFNVGAYYLDTNLEAGRGDRPAIRCGDEVFSYRDVFERSCQAGHVLGELGMRQEDRVLIILPDLPEFAFVWFAAARAGFVIAMVNPLLPAEAFEHYFEYTRARVAVVHHDILEKVLPAAESARFLDHLLVVGGDAGHHMSFEELCQQAPKDLSPADTHCDDPAIWLFTSGSTGKPKAAVHLQHDLPYNTEHYAKQVLGIREDDVSLGVPKLFFGYATGTTLLFPFSVGGTAALFPERSTAETLYEMIEKHRPTILTSVPTMINAMLHVDESAKRDLSSIRLCLSAGEALPEALYRRWLERTGVEILDGIGSAEMFHIYISNYPGDVKPGSLGRLVPGYETRILDAEGKEVEDGEPGALWVRGDSAAVMYWQDHEKTKATFHADWCNTGDQFHRDAEGYYWYHGRTDALLKVGGIWVSPLEIEDCLLGHAAVRECAVIGYRDEADLVKPKALIVLAEGFASNDTLIVELQAHVKARLAKYKYPRLVEFVVELPKNDRGKIDRKELQAREAEIAG
ncbi:MAG: benzoate-CoA ligase family protein [Planctomycetota bacterium]